VRIILLGGPGAGKGTQAKYISEKFRIPQISTGFMLRKAIAEESDLGKEVKQVMESGGLVPDEIILTLIKNRIAQDDCKNGFLFDGFPRTIAQAKSIKALGIEIDFVVEIFVDDAEIIKRISGRRVHKTSGRTYHIEFNPPKTANRDDETDDTLIQREDDKEATVRRRLNVYHTLTQPLIEFYSNWSGSADSHSPKFVQVNGIGKVEDIRDQILDAIATVKA